MRSPIPTFEVRGSVSSGELSVEADEWIRLAFLDFLGLLVAGDGAIRRGVGQLATHHPIEDARLGGHVEHALAQAQRAFHYARSANVLDGDDGNNFAGAAHVGSSVFGALLASSTPETPYASIRAAAVAGYEVGIRAGAQYAASVRPPAYVSSGAAATLAATAAVAQLRGIDTARALNIAAARAPFSALTDVGQRESVGWAAFTAVLAAASVADSNDDASGLFVAPALDISGSLLLSSYRKPYLACRATHSALDAVRQLRDSHAFDLATITSIVVETTTFGSGLTDAAPTSIDGAVFSFPICIALALLYDGPRAADWLGERFLEGRVRALAARVTPVHSDWADSYSPGSYPARVTIVAGGEFTAEIIVPRGDPTLPLSAEDLAFKAREGYAAVPVDAVLRGEGSMGELVPYLFSADPH
jgi:2-methylcitrate dehydratase PrpD